MKRTYAVRPTTRRRSNEAVHENGSADVFTEKLLKTPQDFAEQADNYRDTLLGVISRGMKVWTVETIEGVFNRHKIGILYALMDFFDPATRAVRHDGADADVYYDLAYQMLPKYAVYFSKPEGEPFRPEYYNVLCYYVNFCIENNRQDQLMYVARLMTAPQINAHLQLTDQGEQREVDLQPAHLFMEQCTIPLLQNMKQTATAQNRKVYKTLAEIIHAKHCAIAAKLENRPDEVLVAKVVLLTSEILGKSADRKKQRVQQKTSRPEVPPAIAAEPRRLPAASEMATLVATKAVHSKWCAR